MPYNDYQELFDALQDDEIDAFIISTLSVYKANIYFIQNNMYVVGFYDNMSSALNDSKIGVAKGKGELVDKINQALNDIKADGSYQRLSLKYFPFMNY